MHQILYFTKQTIIRVGDSHALRGKIAVSWLWEKIHVYRTPRDSRMIDKVSDLIIVWGEGHVFKAMHATLGRSPPEITESSAPFLCQWIRCFSKRPQTPVFWLRPLPMPRFLLETMLSSYNSLLTPDIYLAKLYSQKWSSRALKGRNRPMTHGFR